MALILTLNQVTFAPQGKTILSDIDLEINENVFITFTGPSGSGKSTLLRLIATLLTPTSGVIKYQGQPQPRFPKPHYRQEVSYCFQQPSLFGETVRDNLAFPFLIRDQPWSQKHAEQALASVELPEAMIDAPITSLSGGEKQRVALIRNLLFPPKVLLLDEVTTGLDADTKDCVHRLIASYHQQGMTILMVTHDETEIAAAETLVEIRGGRLEAKHE